MATSWSNASLPDVATALEAAFERTASVFAEARGRVNLIGEHTDYSEGFVLPMAIPQKVHVALAARGGQTVRALTTAHALSPGREPVSFELGREARRGTWIDYVQGVVVALRRAGYGLPGGFDLAIASSVPIGAGLSSSAALEVALLRALRKEFEVLRQIDDVTIAKIGRAAETDFVGVPIGIMDQMAASLTAPDGAGDRERDALFIDTRTLAYERVRLPSTMEVAVIDSGVAHEHATGDYATRRSETERAARLLNVPALRDLDISELEIIRAALPDPLDRRVTHVVTENQRVLDAVVALRDGDATRLGRLLRDSHASLRDDFEVSVPAVDRLVTLAQRDPDCLGARMTGGGFGGSIVALAKQGRATAVAQRVIEAYGAPGRVLVPSVTSA